MGRKREEETAAVVERPDQVLFEVKRSETEIVRGTSREFKGKAYVDIRIFFKNGEGEYRPTRKGLTLTRELFQELVLEISKWADSA